MATGRADVWRLAPMVAFVAIVAIWEWRARAGGISTLFFPAPSAIARTLVEMVRSGEMFGLMGTTLSRLVVGLALGGTIGLVVGLLMGWSDNVRTAVDPIISAVHPVPKLALLPLLLIIFGLGDLPGILIVAMAAFFPMAINSMAGVRHIPPIHFEVAQNYGAARRQVFKRIVWPGSLPFGRSSPGAQHWVCAHDRRRDHPRPRRTRGSHLAGVADAQNPAALCNSDSDRNSRCLVQRSPQVCVSATCAVAG